MKKILLAAIVLVIVIGVAIYLYPKQPTVQVPNITNNSTSSTSVATVPGWQTCNYPSFGFRFQYPPDWNVYVYSAHQGTGNTPVKENCGDLDANELNPQITLASSPDWNAGMQIVAARTQPQFLASSTTSLGGYPSYIGIDGSVFANGYKISFGKNVLTATKDSVLSTFQFVSQ